MIKRRIAVQLEMGKKKGDVIRGILLETGSIQEHADNAGVKRSTFYSYLSRGQGGPEIRKYMKRIWGFDPLPLERPDNHPYRRRNPSHAGPRGKTALKGAAKICYCCGVRKVPKGNFRLCPQCQHGNPDTERAVCHVYGFESETAGIF